MAAVDPPPRPFDYIVVNADPPRRVPNALRSFWVADAGTGERREITARLRVQTDHAAMWVEEGVWHNVRRLEEAALLFETRIYSTTREAFGGEWTPGVDNDPRIHVLHVVGLGEDVLGYTSGADEFPRDVYPFSSEAEMIVVNLDAVEVGDGAYDALLARQFQRLVQWYQDRNEARWVKEGLAQLSVSLNGFDLTGLEQAYLKQPDASLTAWDGGLAQRGAAYLFATYFHERFGDTGTRALVAEPRDGIAGFNAALDALDADVTFENIFADWLATNYLDGLPGAGSERYGYRALNLDQPEPSSVHDAYPVVLETTVQQLGAEYIVLRGDADLNVKLVGSTKTPLLDVLPHGGRYFWWSNRADESLTTLTRTLDLSDVERATLTYWTWYDIEPGYDYATVEISTDGGDQWEVLTTPSGTDADPYGNNPGWAYTGRSREWIQEEVDLSPYAGQKVRVRFAYLTDEATVGAGFVLDDIAVPEIGHMGDAESEADWRAAGFLRTDNFVPQRYLALLIGIGDDVTVERLALEEDQTAEWTVPLEGERWREAVLVLSGFSPLTDQAARYRLEIETQ